MLTQTLIFLITTAGDLFVLALLLRFILQWARAPARNQLSQFLAAVTDFVVRPARRLIPGWWGLDFATLLLAWLVAMLELALVLMLKGYDPALATGVTGAAVTFTMPTAPGSYTLKFYAGTTVLATSAAVVVQ